MKMIPFNFERYLLDINKNIADNIKKTYYKKDKDILSSAMLERNKKKVKQKPKYSKRYSQRIYSLYKYSIQNMKRLCEYYDRYSNMSLNSYTSYNTGSYSLYNSYSSYGSYNSYSSYNSYNSYSLYNSYSSYNTSSFQTSYSFGSYMYGSYSKNYDFANQNINKNEDEKYLTNHLGFDKKNIRNRNYKNEYKYEQCNIQQNFFILGYGLELI